MCMLTNNNDPYHINMKKLKSNTPRPHMQQVTDILETYPELAYTYIERLTLYYLIETLMPTWIHNISELQLPRVA